MVPLFIEKLGKAIVQQINIYDPTKLSYFALSCKTVSETE